ncbi:PREDICTED: uncharacterized protein LOC107080916, partial [Cyprinodon variegatus]|uniref:uncharacterized protein LOC107080916 n=1 Tax=Cyprinodon variegatus TaxID=28743 RepID=UPI000742775B
MVKRLINGALCLFSPDSLKGSSQLVVSSEKDGKKDKAAVDKVFFFRILRILRIMVPRFFCMETAYLLLIASMLVARTYCDVWMIQNGTMIESAIIGRSTKDFKIFLFSFIKFMPVIALVNNFLKLGLNELKLRFRERLTKKLYDQYLQGFTYYKMGNLDNRIANPDQLLTQDVEKFCNSVVDLYSNLSKPLLDIILYIFKLTSAIGAQGPAIMMSYLLISGLFLTRLRRPIGKMTVTEQRYEGEYRYVNSRLITNSEEIAFYNGNLREKQTIHATFKKLELVYLDCVLKRNRSTWTASFRGIALSRLRPSKEPVYRDCILQRNRSTGTASFKGNGLPGLRPSKERVYRDCVLQRNRSTGTASFKGTGLPRLRPSKEPINLDCILQRNRSTGTASFKGNGLPGLRPSKEPVYRDCEPVYRDCVLKRNQSSWTASFKGTSLPRLRPSEEPKEPVYLDCVLQRNRSTGTASSKGTCQPGLRPPKEPVYLECVLRRNLSTWNASLEGTGLPGMRPSKEAVYLECILQRQRSTGTASFKGNGLLGLRPPKEPVYLNCVLQRKWSTWTASFKGSGLPGLRPPKEPVYLDCVLRRNRSTWNASSKGTGLPGLRPPKEPVYLDCVLRRNRFTARITELMTVLKELNAGKYERTMVSQHEREAESPEKSLLVPGSGQVINRDNIIKFDHTPLATPNGDLLIRDLSFEVRSGTNVLVCGPNGCGKSSLFRVLGEVRVFGFSNAACFLLL